VTVISTIKMVRLADLGELQIDRFAALREPGGHFGRYCRPLRIQRKSSGNDLEKSRNQAGSRPFGFGRGRNFGTASMQRTDGCAQGPLTSLPAAVAQARGKLRSGTGRKRLLGAYRPVWPEGRSLFCERNG
jgi:hypothetical protein